MNEHLNITEVLNFIQHDMNSEDMKTIDISTTTLYKIKKNPEYIFNMKFHNIIIINDYLKSKKREHKRVAYVGIDLGTKQTITASDSEMKRTLVIQNKRIHNAIKTYESCLNSKNVTIDGIHNVQEMLIRTINTNAEKLVNQLINHYIEPVTFVIGRVYQTSKRKHPHYDLYRILLEKLMKAKKTHAINVLTIDESYTSITCPKCKIRDSKNRTTTNKFECRNCGFIHGNDDIIASVNIVNKFLETRGDEEIL